MNFLKKTAEWIIELLGLNPSRIGIVGYPSIGKTVYLTMLYGICGVRKQCQKMTVRAGKSQQYFQAKWNWITGVERRFPQGTEEPTRFDFKITLDPSRIFCSQTKKIDFIDPPGEVFTVNPQADDEVVKKVEAFLDKTDALLFLIEPDDFDFVALAVKLKALLSTVAQNPTEFEQNQAAFIAQHCDKLQIKLLPEQGSASFSRMKDVISRFMQHADDNNVDTTVDALMTLYKQDANDRAVALMNYIGERLGNKRFTNVAVVITKADKLSPFRQTSPRPTILVPDQLQRHQNIRGGNVQQLAQALSEFWKNHDDRWPPILQQLFETYQHFFADLSRIKGDYQIFFVSAIGDVAWDDATHRTRPPQEIRPQGIEGPVEWCVRQIVRHKINRLRLLKHFLLLLLLVLISWPIQTFNKNIGPALKDANILNDIDTWKNGSAQWWASLLGSGGIQHRSQLLQLQAYWQQLADLKAQLDGALPDDAKIKQQLDKLHANVKGLKISDDETRQIQEQLQRAISEVQLWLEVKTNYAELKNRFVPDFHYQLDCCLSQQNNCQQTLDFSQQVSLPAVQEKVKVMQSALPQQPQYKNLVCLKDKLHRATRQINDWNDYGMRLKFKHGEIPPAFIGLDIKLVVLFGGDEIHSGDDIRWQPNKRRYFKFSAVDSAGTVQYEASYKAPVEFVNNICWDNKLLNLEVRPFLEAYLAELDSLFPNIQKSNCEKW
jgi:chorismate mutase